MAARSTHEEMIDQHAEIQRGVSDDDLLRLGKERPVEVVDGAIVEMSPNSFEHHRVDRALFRVLDHYTLQNPIGEVWFDGVIYLLERYPDGRIKRSRVPDLSFMRQERMPEDEGPIFDGVPDLAVEVASPGNSLLELMARVRDYLAYGSEEVWVIYTNIRELHRYRRDEPSVVHVYRGDEVFEPGSLFPGLKIVGSALFPPQAGA